MALGTRQQFLHRCGARVQRGITNRQISKRFDWRVFDFGYQQYYGLGGEFKPKTFSTGVVSSHNEPRNGCPWTRK